MAGKFGICDIQVVRAARVVRPAEFGFDLDSDYYRNVSGAQTLSHAKENEDALSLCHKASLEILGRHPGLNEQLDAIFVVTLPTEPTVAPISSRLQGLIGARPGTFCLDMTLSCVGFLQAASLVMDLMPARKWKRVLVLNVETLTKIIKPNDHALRLIMSDGATAALFTDKGKIQFERFDFFADGKLGSILGTRDGHMYMDGPKVYETVLRRIPASVRNTMEAAGMAKEDTDLFLFHQASKKILQKLTELLELDPSRVPNVIEESGNMGSCSLPQLLAKIIEESGERRMFATAFGAGFQWAHAVLRKDA